MNITPMIPWIAACFLVVGFVILLKAFGLVDKSKDAIAVTRNSMQIIGDSNLTDEEKEKALQGNAKQLFGIFFVFLFGGAAAVFLPVGILWVAEFKGFLSLPEVWAVAISPLFLTLSTLFVMPTLFISKRRATETTSYSLLDRILHKIAFSTYTAQIGIADIEDRMFADQIKQAAVDRPVFITALPRAGTTLLLESLTQLNEFASHCYRDMPFVLMPLLWNRFPETFRHSGEAKERAHGDGMLVNVDSPEALEEVIWKTFWKKQYDKDRIHLWPEGENEEFVEFFQNHMKKIIVLRHQENIARTRYISKNNLNVARIPLIRRIFPEAVVIIPFRDPLHHASSLLEQHRNFLRIHAEDRFAADYMRAIGHFDFGIHLRPIDFDHWYDQRGSQDPQELAFWLEYWAAGYRHLLKQIGDNVHLFNYRKLCENPEDGLTVLSDLTQIRDSSALMQIAPTIHPSRKRDIDVEGISSDLLERVASLYETLDKNSSN